MLETKPQPIERTVRMAARPASRASAGHAASALPRTPERPVPAPSPERADARLSRSEARLLTTAISCTVIVCTLLVIYLAAYAHVTLLGMGQATLRRELREKRLENETLKADLAVALNPNRVASDAAALGMKRDYRRVDYIAPPPRQGEGDAELARSTTSNDVSDRVATNSGPTADQFQPARND